MSESPIKSILFVCWGNICRSPAAENVMRELLAKEGLEKTVSCDSAGTIDSHQGNPPDARMSKAGKRRGLPMTGAARGIEKRDFDAFDLIVAMDYANLEDLQRFDSEKIADGKIHMFCSFCKKHTQDEVPDPYYEGTDGFEHVLDLLEDGCQQLLDLVKRSWE